jgi:hypothetical protein
MEESATSMLEDDEASLPSFAHDVEVRELSKIAQCIRL